MSVRSGFDHVVVGGVEVARASRAGLVAAMIADCKVRQREPAGWRARLVFSSNAQSLSLAATDAAYRAAMDKADIVHADGGLVVMASRALTQRPIPERSCTTDMFYDFAAAANAHGLSFYLLGATEEVNAECERVLAKHYPNLKIAGRHHGYFGREDEDRIVSLIADAEPDVLWVGLGKPAEQQFASRHGSRLTATWVVTCGGCFNYVTGHYRRAPEWMRNNSLEWLHRALTDPRRLLWRYLTTNPHAVWLALTRTREVRS